MVRPSILALALLLGACSQEAAQSDAADAAPAPAAAANDVTAAAPAPTASAKPSLEGSWTVSDVQGEPGNDLSVSFGSGVATMAAGCVRRSWTYTQNGGAVAFKTNASGSTNCGGGTTAAQEAAFAALADANMAIFEADGNGVALSGYGGAITLKRR